MTAVIDTEATTGKLGSRTNANSYAFLNAYSRLGHTSKAYSFFNIRRELNYSLTPFKDENGDVTQPNDALLLIRSMRHSNAITNTSWSLMNDPEPVIDTVLLSMRNSKTKLTKPFVAELLEVFARAATVPFRGTSARDNDRHRKSMCLKAVRYHRKLTNHGMPGLSAVGSDVVIANVMVKVHSRAGLLEVAEGHWEDWFKVSVCVWGGCMYICVKHMCICTLVWHGVTRPWFTVQSHRNPLAHYLVPRRTFRRTPCHTTRYCGGTRRRDRPSRPSRGSRA